MGSVVPADRSELISRFQTRAWHDVHLLKFGNKSVVPVFENSITDDGVVTIASILTHLISVVDGLLFLSFGATKNATQDFSPLAFFLLLGAGPVVLVDKVFELNRTGDHFVRFGYDLNAR